MDWINKIYCGDALGVLKQMPDNFVDMVMTSPPYNQNLTTQNTDANLYRDDMDEIEYINNLQYIFAEIKRILKDNGSFVYNYKTDVKNNVLKPSFRHLEKVNKYSMFFLSAEIVWKYAGNFDSSRKRFPTDYEMLYQLTKSNDYKFNDCNIALTSVWNIKHVMFGTDEKNDAGAHPCPYPTALIIKILNHLSDENDIILDPYFGSGSLGVACERLKRNWIGIEISPEYCKIAEERIKRERDQLKLF